MIRHTRGDVPSIQFPKRNAVEHFAPLHDADERLEECLRILAKESGKTGRIAKLLYKKFRQSILELVSYLYERESSDDPGRETLRYLRRKSKERALVATKAAFEWLLHRTGAIWKLGLSPEQDPKLQALIHVLGEHWKKHESTKGILEFLQPSELPVIVFTAENSGRDIIAAQLRRHFPEQRIEGFTDNMKGPQRKELLANFNEGRVDVLVCATSQSRGLNLQYGSILINMDLPVSPVELEQRIGRVQRLGQDKPIVHIVNIMYEIESERWLWEGYKEYLMMFQEVLGDTDLISIFTASDTPKRVEEIYQSIISGELNHQQTKLKFKEAAEEMKRAVESHRQSLRRESDDDEPPVIP
ncbi:MAG: hypothetical protein DRN81_02210 [Thermoproteota archaeon]|nr:MAG: hypothetical protein DRN81_02210 [Candidatus Korarchaeota archaeon]